MMLYFFFSSRRRHTSWNCDWSSDVCSSDLDGLRLTGAYIAPLARCAPPANKPTPEEIAHCREYLTREWALLTEVRAVLALGRVAMDGFLALLREAGRVSPRARPAFGH